MWDLGVHGRRWTLDSFFCSFYLESEYANGVFLPAVYVK